MAMSRPSDYEDGTGVGGPVRVTSPDIGVKGWLRWFWRQLTSMRVALILLLLLAVAAIPGSLFPQRSADPNGVIQYEEDNPELFPVLDAFPIQAFDVYDSVWFSSIYLLLFISLIACVLPRIAHHWKSWRGKPPKTPARLTRMAGFSEIRVANPQATEEDRLQYAEGAVRKAAMQLKKQRYRVDVQHTQQRGATEVSVSAERGYLRETGNLVFHLSLLGVLVCVAIGGFVKFNGQKVLVEGQTMLNELIDYDSASSGQGFDDGSLESFSLRLNSLEVDYNTPEDGNLDAIGLVNDYIASVTVFDADRQESEHTIRVNYPLRLPGSPVYLIANGYAPTITVRNADDTIVYSESTPFIPQNDFNMTSLGVVKVPGGVKDESGDDTQLGLRGFFYPTKADLSTGAYTSNYADLMNPVLTLDVFTGDLGIDGGTPQSVYSLDTDAMEQLTGRDLDGDSLELRPGETVDLPNGMGSVTLEAVPRYAAFDVMSDPTQRWVLFFAIAALTGLTGSLFVPRRRMWVKAIPTDQGVTLQYAALARGDDPTLELAVASLRDSHRAQL